MAKEIAAHNVGAPIVGDGLDVQEALRLVVADVADLARAVNALTARIDEHLSTGKHAVASAVDAATPLLAASYDKRNLRLQTAQTPSAIEKPDFSA